MAVILTITEAVTIAAAETEIETTIIAATMTIRMAG
jgi:hypothetical protein